MSDWYSPWQPGRIAGLARYDTFLASPRLHEPAFGAAGGTLMLPSRDNGLKHTPDEFVPLDPAQILVAMLLPIGDTLLATPALAALRRRFPLAKITVVAGRSNAGILTDNPAFDQLVIVDEPGPHRRVVRVARRLSQLRQVKYDLVINLSPVSSLVLMRRGASAARVPYSARPLRRQAPAARVGPIACRSHHHHACRRRGLQRAQALGAAAFR